MTNFAKCDIKEVKEFVFKNQFIALIRSDQNVLKKYYYCKYSEQLFYESLRNEYHFMAFCYGAYLTFQKENNNSNFSEYLQKKLKRYTKNWHFVNITHKILKKNLTDETISRGEIRKLGYSGSQSLPKCSKKAVLIQNCLLNIILSDEEFITAFTEAINKKWGDIDNISTVNKDILFGMIIGFQSNVLLRTKNSRKMYDEMEQSFNFNILEK